MAGAGRTVLGAGAEVPSTSGTSRIEPDAAVAFALATDDPNEACRNGSAVPPMYSCALIRLASASPWGRQDLISGARAGVHGSHDVTFHRAMTPGETLSYHSEPYSLRRTRAGVLTTQRITVSGAAGDLVAEHLWSHMYVGGTAAADLGPDTPDHTFPAAARDRPLDGVEFPISVDQAFRFAGVSGDHNPHCIDGDAARAEGFPDRILQGVCTMAMAAGAVVHAAAGGDVGRLARFACRLAAPVFARTVLRVDLYDAGTAEEGSRLIAFEAGSDGAGGRMSIQHGLAVIRDQGTG